MQGTDRSGEGGRRACYVTPDLSYDKEGERKRRAKIINGMTKKKQKHTHTHRRVEGKIGYGLGISLAFLT